jgi:hypothetical protein
MECPPDGADGNPTRVRISGLRIIVITAVLLTQSTCYHQLITLELHLHS